MPQKKDILNELNEISTAVANLPNNNCLSNPPAGYFSSLSDSIMSKIADAENAQRINPFISPVTLSTEISPEIELNPVWGNISKTFPLESPGEMYFQNLKNNVLSRIADEQEVLLQSETRLQAPIVSLTQRNRRSFVMQWAAAAAIVVLVGLSTLFYFQNEPTSSNSVNLTAELPKIDDQELSAFIGDQPHEVITENSLANANTDDFDFHNLFSDVKDDEMKAYLQQDKLSNIVNLN